MTQHDRHVFNNAPRAAPPVAAPPKVVTLGALDSRTVSPDRGALAFLEWLRPDGPWTLTATLSDFCERIGISKATFWKYVKAGKIHVIRIGGRTLVPHCEAVRISTEGV
jgi:hypothetical protein